ncbi:MAG: hypothetical protein J5518_07450 [Lachnospiraceae bacterium]|nr:hypothetical protein [Lachnospiraceae bacterium]
MDMTEQTNEILSHSNFEKIAPKLSDFVQEYIKKLILDLVTYVNADISVGEIETVSEYYAKKELSQEITGVPSAYSAMDAAEDALISFAADYSKMEVNEYDILVREALLDFLNLHNGLFVVQLSKLNICELSLAVPKQNGAFLMTSPATGEITVIPVTFPYGTIRFLLCELEHTA